MLRLAEIEPRHKVSAPFKGESSPEKQYNIVREDRAYLLSEVQRLQRIEKCAADLTAIIGEFTDRNGLVQMSANADAVRNLTAALEIISAPGVEFNFIKRGSDINGDTGL